MVSADSKTVIFLTMSEHEHMCIQVYAPWRPWANQQKVLNVVCYKHFVRFYAVKTSKISNDCLLSSLHKWFRRTFGGVMSCTFWQEIAGERGCFLGRNWDKKSFAPCYSQSPPPEDFTPPYGWTWDFYTPTTKSGWGLGIVYVISLFTFESSIVLLSYYTLFVNKYICFL